MFEIRIFVLYKNWWIDPLAGIRALLSFQVLLGQIWRILPRVGAICVSWPRLTLYSLCLSIRHVFSLRHVFFFLLQISFLGLSLLFHYFEGWEYIKNELFYNMSTERCVIITFCVLFRWECVIKKSPAGKIGLAGKTAWR